MWCGGPTTESSATAFPSAPWRKWVHSSISSGHGLTVLVHGNLAWIFRHDEVDQVVDVGQSAAVEHFERYRAIQIERSGKGSGTLDPVGVARQAMDEESVIQPQFGRERSVATADVDD